MNHRTAATTVASLAAAALLVAPAAPALAAVAVVKDGDDSRNKADIDKVRIVHKADRVKVKIFFDDLVRDGLERSQGVSIFFDTDPDDRGPEFRLGSGLNDGTDYQLSRVENWRDQGRSLRRCDYLGRIRWGADTATFLVDPACFGDVDEVAVAVKAGESRGTGRERTDWLGGRRTFTDPVARD